MKVKDLKEFLSTLEDDDTIQFDELHIYVNHRTSMLFGLNDVLYTAKEYFPYYIDTAAKYQERLKWDSPAFKSYEQPMTNKLMCHIQKFQI